MAEKNQYLEYIENTDGKTTVKIKGEEFGVFDDMNKAIEGVNDLIDQKVRANVIRAFDLIKKRGQGVKN